ncbi:NADP-dependent oxidoreductase [Paenibacillus chitinolyticus]|uniref:NADP-dependent oxidoreductase n=1 Tax=Paenibacillus chitinolyticus TaxID=79263 RepID=UPI002DB9BE8C|nr:NADP-dependent oxidoreductase [Paenibacillus chitinolyticus]MEC0244565.1 NADP-dependent oxidoreductase [Paenibacillus chitinolyticus]
MKAIVINNYGNPEDFEEQDISIPIIKETQVLVEMYATTVSSADKLVLSGAFQHMLSVQFPHVLGVELAGVVKEIGEKVTHVKAGDRVMGLVRTGGSYADYVALEESALTIIPSTLSFVEAAALPAGALTAWQSLFQYANLQPGQRILIHAGAGGVGHIAVQLAKQHGAYVITTARKHNHEFVRQLGADEVIDYTTTDFAKAVSPVDIVLDMVRDTVIDTNTGIEVTESKNYTILKESGKLISLVDPSIAKHPKIRAIESQFAYIEPNPSDLATIVQSVQEHKLKVHVDGIFPFTAEGIAEAYHHKHKKGKLVIQRKPF